MNKDATELELTKSPCEVEHISTLNSDRMVVDAARVSFGGKAGDEITARDRKLVAYLARNGHMSPFRHLMLTLRIRAPEATMRQFYKHVVGIEATSTHATKDHAWNEVSGRYRKLGTLYHPAVWNAQHKSAKQCSGDALDDETQEKCNDIYEMALRTMWAGYDSLIELGAAKEQARLLLPMAFVTEVVWTASLEAVYHFVKLRNDSHSQFEIQVLARAIEEVALREFPVAYAALRGDPVSESTATE